MPDPMFQIPTASGWSAIGFTAIALLSWIFRTERRASKMLTREDHDKICEKNQEAIASDLKQIKTMLTDQNDKALEHRNRVEGTLGTIKTDVAVLQSRMDESRDVEITRVRSRRSKT